MSDEDIDKLIEMCAYTKADYIIGCIALLVPILLLIWTCSRI